MGKHRREGDRQEIEDPRDKCAQDKCAQGKRLDPLSVFGEVLLTFGIIAPLFAFWEVYWTNLQSGRQQSGVTRELASEWNDKNPRPLKEPTEGTAFARLSIPSFGSDFSFSVVKGVTDEDLNIGPGHYMDTQEPGQPGNFAIAATE